MHWLVWRTACHVPLGSAIQKVLQTEVESGVSQVGRQNALEFIKLHITFQKISGVGRSPDL